MNQSVSIKKNDGEFIRITYNQENTEELVAFQWLFDLLGYGFMFFGISFMAVSTFAIVCGTEKITTFIKSI